MQEGNRKGLESLGHLVSKMQAQKQMVVQKPPRTDSLLSIFCGIFF